jgi:hypothetical protein
MDDISADTYLRYMDASTDATSAHVNVSQPESNIFLAYGKMAE